MDDNLVHALITIFSALAASSGFWAFAQRKAARKTACDKMVLGLGHDRILYLCKKHLDLGFITPDDLENLLEYLYEPYADMGGNGTAKKYIEDVKKLPHTLPKVVKPRQKKISKEEIA